VSRKTYKVNDYVQNSDVSTKVESDIGIIAERSMYWDSGGIEWVGGHTSSGVTNTSTTWYLAEGCTRGFDTWLLLQNPNSVRANVTLTFMIPDGNPIIVNDIINAVSRKTYKVNDYVQNSDVSTKVESDIGIIAEKSMYWDSAGIKWVGGHCNPGVISPSTTWYLAEGCTRGSFSEWVLIQNPNNQSANVAITFMKSDGSIVTATRVLNPVSRETILVNNYVKGGDVSIIAESDVGIIVERSMYWDSAGIKWIGGHCSSGVTSPSESWYLAEGCTTDSFSEWLLIQNPNSTEADVVVTFMTMDGKATTVNVSVGATSRYTIRVNDYV